MRRNEGPAPAGQRSVLPVIPSNPEPRRPFRSLRTSPTNVRAATHWDYLFRSRPAACSCKVFLDRFAGQIHLGCVAAGTSMSIAHIPRRNGGYQSGTCRTFV